MFSRIAFAVLVATAPCAAFADEVAMRHGAWQATAQAEQVEAQLSERYAQLWAKFDAATRARFAAGERHWLNVTRFDEQSRCVAQHSEATALVVAACRAAVVERRIGTLERTQVATKH